MQRNYDYVLKFVIIGSSSVGKSSILKRFADDQFEQSYISTIGIDFRFKSLQVGSDYIKLQIWDTAGQQRFRGITKSYYNGANAVILVYDINNQKSFEDIAQFWVKQTKLFSSSDHIFCLINKCDNSDRQISQEQKNFLREQQIRWYQVSAKTGYMITESILEIAHQIAKNIPKINNKQNKYHALKQTNNQAVNKSKCCQRS